MNELTNNSTNEIVTNELLKQFLVTFGIGSNLSEGEKVQFMEVAKAFNLNPFKREIHCIPYGNGDNRKLSLITGFEVYLKRAERTGMLDGWKAWTEGTIVSKTIVKKMKRKDGGTWEKELKVWEGDLKAIVEIYRKDRSKPFIHEVYFSEYSQDNDMWAEKPRTMIKKVAMSQAFRLCFPDELAGMPYTPDELPDEMGTLRNVTPQPQEVQPVAVEVVAQAEVKPETPRNHDFEKHEMEVKKAVASILKAEGNPDAWTAKEKDLIGARTLVLEAREKQDGSILDALLIRAKIGALVRGTKFWDDTMKMVLDLGYDIPSLEMGLKSLETQKKEGKL